MWRKPWYGGIVFLFKYFYKTCICDFLKKNIKVFNLEYYLIQFKENIGSKDTRYIADWIMQSAKPSEYYKHVLDLGNIKFVLLEVKRWCTWNSKIILGDEIKRYLGFSDNTIDKGK